jgi:hypothetical protein
MSRKVQYASLCGSMACSLDLTPNQIWPWHPRDAPTLHVLFLSLHRHILITVLPLDPHRPRRRINTLADLPLVHDRRLYRRRWMGGRRRRRCPSEMNEGCPFGFPVCLSKPHDCWGSKQPNQTPISCPYVCAGWSVGLQPNSFLSSTIINQTALVVGQCNPLDFFPEPHRLTLLLRHLQKPKCTHRQLTYTPSVSFYK